VEEVKLWLLSVYPVDNLQADCVQDTENRRERLTLQRRLDILRRVNAEES